jgi:hypothetical protein
MPVREGAMPDDEALEAAGKGRSLILSGFDETKSALHATAE